MATKRNIITLAERMGLDNEVLLTLLDQFAFALRVAMPGIISEFDATRQIAKVQIAITEDVVWNGLLEKMAIPQLLDVPIVFPRAGNYVLTMPVSVGDECLVVFGDCCFDAWWENGNIQGQIDKRRHDLSDAFAIIGPWSQPKKITGYSTTSAQLRDLEGTTFVEIAPDGVINITAAAEINVTAGADINIESAAKVNIAGAAEVNIEASGNTIIEDKNFLLHTHTGVVPGAANTGAVT